jgi:hypothetical protein
MALARIRNLTIVRERVLDGACERNHMTSYRSTPHLAWNVLQWRLAAFAARGPSQRKTSLLLLHRTIAGEVTI